MSRTEKELLLPPRLFTHVPFGSQIVFLINLAGYTDFSVVFLPWLLGGADVLRNPTPVRGLNGAFG